MMAEEELTCPSSSSSKDSIACATLLSLSDTSPGSTKEEDMLKTFLKTPEKTPSHRGRRGGPRTCRTPRTASIGLVTKVEDENKYTFSHFEETSRYILRYRCHHTVWGVGRLGLNPQELSTEMPGDSFNNTPVTHSCKTEYTQSSKQSPQDRDFVEDRTQCSSKRSSSAPQRQRPSSCSGRQHRRVYLTWAEYVRLRGPEAAPSPSRPVTCNFLSAKEITPTPPPNRPRSQRLQRPKVKDNWRGSFQQSGCFTT